MPDAGGRSAEAMAQGIAAGDRQIIARALNLVEDRRGSARTQIGELLTALARGEPRESQCIGLTGPPGVGKSTLAAALTRAWRRRGQRVGVVAVDPSSVRSGGSLLGDRARMSSDPSDEGAFIRSLATAGDPGGLSWAANAAARVLAAAFDVVIVETTGVGQTETDVEQLADTVVLVVQPGSGDTLQFLKAGIMEIPDFLLVNKADQGDLAVRTVADLRSALSTARAVGLDADRPILAVSAVTGQGIEELIDTTRQHWSQQTEEQRAARRWAGDVAWARALFLRRHGEHGLEVLEPIDTRIEAHLGQGVVPPVVADKLSAEYTSCLTDDS